MKAQLIGERSAGMTAVEVYNDNNDLVWAHRWFDNGCSTSGYISGLCDAFDCMRRCADVAMFDGGEVDEDGDPVAMDTESTTGVMLEYDTSTGWSIGDNGRALGQSSEIIDACMAAGLIEADDDHEDHEDHADSDVVAAISKHIKSHA